MHFKIHSVLLAFLTALSMLPGNLPAEVVLVSAPNSGQLASATANGMSVVQMISADGRFVVFSSDAGNLTTNNPNSFLQSYLRDRTTRRTTLLSATPDGAASHGFSSVAYMSDDGQKFVLESDAADLVLMDTNEVRDIFWRDLESGQTMLLSVNTNGLTANGESKHAMVSPDARHVAYESRADDLTPGDTNQVADVFVLDRNNSKTTLASLLPDKFVAQKSDNYSLSGISSNGQFVLFSVSCAFPASGASYSRQVFVRDMVAGTTTWVGTNVAAYSGIKLSGPSCFNESMTPDGNYVTFLVSTNTKSTHVYRHEISTGNTQCIATNTVAIAQGTIDTMGPVQSEDARFVVYVASGNASNIIDQIYRWDATTGSNTLVSAGADSSTPGNAASNTPQISPDGRHILFFSLASNLTAQPVGANYEVYLRDMDSETTQYVDTGASDGSGLWEDMVDAIMTPGAKWVAFDTGSDLLVDRDQNGSLDVFVRELSSGAVDLVSSMDSRMAGVTQPGMSMSSSLGVSIEGRYILFSSTSETLALGDTNRLYDIFLRDTLSGTTRLVTANVDGSGTQNDSSPSPASISDDGRFVAFDSYASNLNSLDTNALADVFVRDMWTNTNILASVTRTGAVAGNSLSPLITPDGRFVLYISLNKQISAEPTGTANYSLYSYNIDGKTNSLTTPTNLYPPSITGSQPVILSTSQDRRVLAVGYGNYGFGVYNFQVRDFLFKTNSPKYIAALSGDGKRLVYNAGSTANTPILYVFDLEKRVVLTSLNAGAINKIGVNFDGSRIAYELSANAQSQWTQVYVWDVASGSNILASVSGNGTGAGSGSSHLVAITPDGSQVVFNSMAEDLVPGDDNSLTDVYMRDLTASKTWLLSENRFHTGSGNSQSVGVALSADGTTLVFDSMASDLIEADYNNARDVFFVKLPGVEPPIHLAALIQTDGTARLTWNSVVDGAYRVQYKDDLSEPAWQALAGDVVATESTAQKLDGTATQKQRYYRIMRLP